MMVAQKWVMLSVAEGKCISTQAGESNWPVSDEGKIYVSFSIRFVKIYFILFQTLFSYLFLSSGGLLVIFPIDLFCLVLLNDSMLFPSPFRLGLC